MTATAINNPQEDLAKLRRSPAMASWQKAMQDLNNDRHAPALATYRNLVHLFPGVPQLWAELGLAAAGELEFAEADQAYQRALGLAPSDPSLSLFIGWQYYHLRRMDQFSKCLQRAVALDPSSARARLALASWQERSRRLDEAWECIEACLTRHPKDGQALYFKAFLLHRKGLDGESETALQNLLRSDPLPPPEVQANANYLLGEVLDATGQYSAALGCLERAKSLRRKMVNIAAREHFDETVDQTRRQTLADLTPETLRRWRDEAAEAPCPHRLAILGGAPRSGTTLVEQVLAAHPGILVIDELHSFGKEVVNKILPPPQSRFLTLKSLNDLPAAERSRMISRYFKSLLRETEEEPGGRLLLDKNPSRTAWLHAWLRFFPLSKVIIALRDPRDVVISCYFQNIAEDWAIVGLSSLERTAEFYSDCMDVWLRMKELGGFEWMETRYEDVVGNLEGEGRRLTQFLGLPWQSTQAAFHDTARNKFVHSPTYNDVAKPVHKRAVRRWEHYAEALAPLQEELAKYCRAFGYG